MQDCSLAVTQLLQLKRGYAKCVHLTFNAIVSIKWNYLSKALRTEWMLYKHHSLCEGQELQRHKPKLNLKCRSTKHLRWTCSPTRMRWVNTGSGGGGLPCVCSVWCGQNPTKIWGLPWAFLTPPLFFKLMIAIIADSSSHVWTTACVLDSPSCRLASVIIHITERESFRKWKSAHIAVFLKLLQTWVFKIQFRHSLA